MNEAQEDIQCKYTFAGTAGIYRELPVSWYLPQQGTSPANNTVQWMVQ